MVQNWRVSNMPLCKIFGEGIYKMNASEFIQTYLWRVENPVKIKSEKQMLSLCPQDELSQEVCKVLVPFIFADLFANNDIVELW